MSESLYEEAILDAKRLREMAEQNAKNQIIDAITPKIRQLVEKQLIDEAEEIEDLESDALDIVLPDEMEEENVETSVLDLDALAPVGVAELEIGVEDEPNTAISIAPGADADIEVDVDGTVDIEAGDVEIHVGNDEMVIDSEEELLLSKESVQALINIIHGTDVHQKIDESLRCCNALLRKTKRLGKVLEALEGKNLNSSQQIRVCNHYRNLLHEIITLRDEVILTEGEQGSSELQTHIDQLLKEIRKMSQRRNKILKRLLEAEEEKQEEREELDELDAILTLEPADEDEAEEVEDLLADLEIDVNLEEPVETVEVETEEEVEVEVGEETAEVEVEEGDEMEETYEIDESMLRRELRRMRRLREQEESDAVDASPAPGGLDGEVVEVDEEDLLNALDDELGDPGVPEPKVESRRRRNARKINESRKTRALQRKLVEYKKAVASLRNQLIEMNLFNAKLLYKSLTTSLAKRSGKTLTEGRIAKTLGSSSRSTRSAAPANNGKEVDRWAVLAGIANKDN